MWPHYLQGDEPDEDSAALGPEYAESAAAEVHARVEVRIHSSCCTHHAMLALLDRQHGRLPWSGCTRC